MAKLVLADTLRVSIGQSVSICVHLWHANSSSRMKQVLLIACGGGLGAVLRWWVAALVKSRPGEFPLGIFLVNVSGCFLFGLLCGICEARGAEWKLAVLTGLLGGYTTFSTFGWDTYQLLRSGQGWMAALNAAGSVVAGVLAVWAGIVLSGRGGAP
jgi:CrcB protein